MITEAIHNANLKYLNEKIKIILVDDLGKYQIMTNGTVQSEIPAVRVEPPKLPDNHKFKKDSGVEVIISRETEPVLNPLLGSNAIEEKYQIRLTQYNLTKSIKIPALKLANSKLWNVFDNPIILPFAETGEGLIYPSAIIKMSINYHQPFI